MKYSCVQELLWDRFQRHFWSKVEEDGDGCLIWTGSRYARGGYGRVQLMASWDRVTRSKGMSTLMAHKVAYEIAYGPVPHGAHVLHVCDKPACVHPGHLFAGTPLDNMMDRHLKGKYAGYATEATVKFIREQAAAGVSQRMIARQTGRNRATVYRVVHRLSPYL